MYTVYKTVNLVNKKFYIGVHKTNDPTDSYLGSGKLIKAAVAKYGSENFQKEILLLADDADTAFRKEAELVTREVIESGLCYNLKLGGEGGFDYINSQELANRNRKIASVRNYADPVYLKKLSEAAKAGHGEADKKAREKRKIISDDEIISLLKEYESSRSPVRAVCRHLGVNQSGGLSRRIRNMSHQLNW